MPNWAAYRSPVLEAARVHSWDELERGSQSCAVQSVAGSLTIRGEAGPQQLPLGASAEEICLAVLLALGTG
jgi:hypothetical protein